MVIKNIENKDLKHQAFRECMKEKMPVVFDSTLFPGIEYIRDTEKLDNFMEFIYSTESDEFFYIIPNVCIVQDREYGCRTLEFLRESKNTIFKYYTFYDSHNRNLINKIEQNLKHGPMLSVIQDSNVKSAALAALDIEYIYESKLEFVSRCPILTSDKFLKLLIDNCYKHIKPLRPNEFLEDAKSLEAVT